MLAFAPYSALAKGIARNQPVIVRHGIGYADKEWIRRAPSTPVPDMHRALKQAFACHRAALGRVRDAADEYANV